MKNKNTLRSEELRLPVDMLNILIVDDDEEDRDIIKNFLDEFSRPLNIIEAVNGKSGIQLCRQKKFDCVFLDFMMPDINGYDVLREIINHDPTIIVIVLTGNMDKVLYNKILNAGASDFIEKNNLDRKLLIKTLNFSLERNQYVEEILNKKQELEKLSGDLENLVELKTVQLNEARELAEKRALQAEMATDAKNNFLAMISHEIRTPLNGIIGVLSLFQDSPLNEEQKMLMGIMEKSSDALMSLINDILDFSKIGSGILVLDQYEFDIYSLVDEAIQILKNKAKEKNIVIFCKFDPSIDKYFIGDKARIKQILLNLIGNAIKFTKEGNVDILIEKYSQVGEKVLLKVAISDTGIGMSPEGIQRIFEPFTQADGTILREFGGTGLGLSIVKQLVSAMDGDIYANSIVGKGSNFVFTMLLKPSKYNNEENVLKNSKEKKSNKDKLTFNAHQESKSVLLVEDNPVNCIVTCSMLKKMGYHVDYAQDGDEAIRMAKTGKYSVVLMDCHLPGKDGFKATEEIRQWEQGMHRIQIPIIALTADIVDGTREKCYQAGMNDYLSKPFVFNALKVMLDKYVLLTNR